MLPAGRYYKHRVEEREFSILNGSSMERQATLHAGTHPSLLHSSKHRLYSPLAEAQTRQ